ncbi:hypothetical protein Tco_1162972 [Tanacetum coccineum]
MCINSWGRSSFAWYLIEINADDVLKDSLTMGIPLFDGLRFSNEMVRIEYEWKPPRCGLCKIFGHVLNQCPKNIKVTPIVEKSNDVLDEESDEEVENVFDESVNLLSSAKSWATTFLVAGDAT